MRNVFFKLSTRDTCPYKYCNMESWERWLFYRIKNSALLNPCRYLYMCYRSYRRVLFGVVRKQDWSILLIDYSTFQGRFWIEKSLSRTYKCLHLLHPTFHRYLFSDIVFFRWWSSQLKFCTIHSLTLMCHNVNIVVMSIDKNSIDDLILVTAKMIE